jgi:hypothetical protein
MERPGFCRPLAPNRNAGGVSLKIMNLKDARTFALSLPEATEEPHFEMSSFRVRGKLFATVPPDGDHLHIFIDEHETRGVVAGAPLAFEELWWGRRLCGVRVNLEAAGEETVFELLEESWRRKAPRRVVAAFDAGRAGSPGSV